MLAENVWRCLLGEGGICESLLDLGDFELSFFKFLLESRFFSLGVNGSFQRKRKLAHLGMDCWSSLGRHEIRIDVQSLCIEQEFNHFGFVSGDLSRRFNDVFSFLAGW